MQPEAEFKFEPIWVTTLTLLVLYVSFEFISTFLAKAYFGLFGLSLLLIPAILCWLVLPMTFLMIRKKPAVALTPDHLIDNIGGFRIDWHDIEEINVTTRGYRSGGNLMINLKDPKKYFNTPVKQISYQLRHFFTSADISIKMDFIAGKNDKIAQLINAYWFKNTRPTGI